MSSTFKRGQRWWVKTPRPRGGWRNKPTRTRDSKLAARMARMLDELRDRREWELLSAVLDNVITVPELYDAYVANALDELRVRLRDPDLRPHLEEWLAAGAVRWSSERAGRYRRQVTAFLKPRGWRRSALTVREVTGFLAALPIGPSTQRTYHAALSGFSGHLVGIGLLSHNPMRDVRAPAQAAPRTRHLEHEEVLRLVKGQQEPYRTLSAVMHATGAEVSVALKLRRRDIEREGDRLWVHLRGTKTLYRDRRVPLDPWARPIVERHLRTLLPDAPLFPGINRWTASDQHRAACATLKIEDYQLRDSRHTFAVRAIRAGASFEAVARMLGHGSTAMVARVYGRYVPNRRELTDWQEAAAKRDKKRGRAGA